MKIVEYIKGEGASLPSNLNQLKSGIGTNEKGGSGSQLNLHDMRGLILKLQLKEKGIDKCILIECNQAFTTSLLFLLSKNHFTTPIGLFTASVVLARLYSFQTQFLGNIVTESEDNEENTDMLSDFLDHKMLIRRIIMILKATQSYNIIECFNVSLFQASYSYMSLVSELSPLIYGFEEISTQSTQTSESDDSEDSHEVQMPE